MSKLSARKLMNGYMSSKLKLDSLKENVDKTLNFVMSVKTSKNSMNK